MKENKRIETYTIVRSVMVLHEKMIAVRRDIRFRKIKYKIETATFYLFSFKE